MLKMGKFLKEFKMVVNGKKFLKQKYLGQKSLFLWKFFALKTISKNNGTFQTEQ
mgnify:CR=1 FL=1